MSESKLLIRDAVDEDVSSIADLFNRSLSVEHEITGQKPFRFGDDHVRTRLMPGAKTLAAVLAGEVVGFCVLSDEVGPNSTAVYALYVDPLHLREGVGQSLLTAALRTAGDRLLTVNCHRENTPARQLYEKNGFVCGMYMEEQCVYFRGPLDQCRPEADQAPTSSIPA